ncbi:hypothetical protein EVAR_6747_1 [Eumeta japonica]|uniref:Uncharacterized protein n=1 Tax=Eumeta variegata TaxID=151549 RepID=A0A4C1V491_EUMVA|nr:hypothetical protein EVAR_6747_1 [Eumeta japonica]
MVKYHTIGEYDCEGAATVVSFRPVIESSGEPLSLLPLHCLNLLSIRYSISSQETSNTLVTPQGLRVPMGDGDRLLGDGLSARFPLEYAINSSKSRDRTCQVAQSSRARMFTLRPASINQQARPLLRPGHDPYPAGHSLFLIHCKRRMAIIKAVTPD